ncbi:transporter [Philodulcilactobacillus myokoensis]|uniref:Transporter n=1 Tax=Philodulcilactobacillus myokoensis TaxID=2929573 RepID=A0A9W6ESR4_9LACO|nr:MMPL family transporter [Philodulcilactobacillus myokoensis]GLB47316.1 transporter [Philodulcilactobacillus myokoensis]
MKTIKKLYHNRVISIVIWLVIIFIAILKLPNITNLITNQGQPQFNANSQIIQSKHAQLNWGRNISNTQEADVVYHNPNGVITKHQQSTINASISALKGREKSNGIKQINSLENDPNEKYQLKSNDGSTEIVKIYVNPQVISSSQLVSDINGTVNNKISSHLRSYVTNPNIINNEAYQKIASITHVITIIIFIFSIIIIGCLFKSIIAPIIGFITLLISYTVSLSIISNLSLRYNFPFNAYTPILTLLGTVILGTLFLFIFYREFHKEIFHRKTRTKDYTNYTNEAIRKIRLTVISTSLILALAFGSSILTSFSSVRALFTVGITFIVLIFTILTLMPVFTFLLEESIFWPNKHGFKETPHKLWNKLTRFSLWQPIAGIVLVIYFVVPFAYAYRNNLDYTNSDYINNSQAKVGADVLKAHFYQGKPTPLTVYVQSNHKLDNESSLETIDRLTTKLQTMKHVKAAYSVTQPSSMPISKYYVKNQLNSVIGGINQIQVTLHNAVNTTNHGKRQLNLKQLNKQINYLNRIVNQSNQSLSNNSDLQNQLQNISSNASVPQVSVSKKVAKKIAVYQRKINQLSRQLDQTNNNLNRLNSNSQNINSNSQTVQSNLKTYKNQLGQVNNDLKSVKKDVNQANDKLDGIYSYLDGLRSASKGFYYITPSQMADTDFQQNVYNYISTNQKMTKLSIEFQNAPNGTTRKELSHLRSEINTELQGTNLKGSKIMFAGEPVKHATIQRNFQRSFFEAGLLSIAIILIVTMIISRSILHPIYWMGAFIISGLAGLQLTNFTMSFIFNTVRFNWYASLLITFILTMIAVWKLLPISLMFRKRNISMLQWFEPSLTTLGQSIRYTIAIVITIMIGLIFIPNAALMETAFTVIYTVIIFNIIIPIIVASFGKLSYTIPNPDLRRPSHLFKKRNK